MAKKSKTEMKTITLIQWMIEKMDTKGYRAGTASGYHHPGVDSAVMKAVGGKADFQCESISECETAGRKADSIQDISKEI